MAPASRGNPRLFHAIVIMGAALGSSACDAEGPRPDAAVAIADAGPSDAPTDGAPTDVPVDTVLIL